MKQLWQFLRMVALSSALVALAACSGGQGAAASKASSRAVINAGEIVPAEQIRVGEYMRYYEQDFAAPEEGALGFDLRLGNPQAPQQGGLVWLQLGMQAQRAGDNVVGPMNLALVIDRSGSMDSAEKMPYVKQALRLVLQSLRADDIIALVTYGSTADLLLPAQPVGDGRWIEETLNRIVIDGDTNLHAGLMLGFSEVTKNYDPSRNNRVILLTDGIANHGVTDPAQIAEEALAYNERGIYLSTIGLGLDFNDGLLSRLAEQGQGGYSFVDSAQELDRVFKEHLAGVQQRVADDLSLTLVPAPGVQLIGLTDYKETPPAQGAHILLPAVGAGDSAVLLAQFQLSPTAAVGMQPLAQVQISYFDQVRQQPVTIDEAVQIEVNTALTAYDPTQEPTVLRNVTIQMMAEGMIEIDELFQTGQYEAAWQIAVDLEERLTQVSRLTNDPQIAEDLALIQRYEQTLADALYQNTGQQPNRPVTTSGDAALPHDLIATPTPAVPVIDLR